MLDFSFATPSEICSELGARLKRQRLTANLSQEQVATRSGLSLGTVNRMEQHGQATLESWIKVLLALDLVDELQPLLVPSKPTSIAQMERESQPERVRASRRRKP